MDDDNNTELPPASVCPLAMADQDQCGVCEVQTKGAYELAMDTKIPPELELRAGKSMHSIFERTKQMRSEVIVETGIMNHVALRIHDIIPKNCMHSNLYVVTDSVTDELYAEPLVSELKVAGLKVAKLVVDSVTDMSGESSTEPSKDVQTYLRLVDAIIRHGVDKHSCIISVGGGVVNNICGFLAGCIYRGISLVHFSTTMMGMVDAAIDFKQAVNHCCGKNLLGCYYPATKIVLDPACLSTLSTRHVRNGIAESLKHGMVHSTELLDFILREKAVTNLDKYSEGYLDGIIRRTIAIKAPTLTQYHESDFNEMAPQYGHAPAHAVEILSWHGGANEPLLHGEAVAIGMCVSAETAFQLGVCDASVVEDHYRVCAEVGLPTCVPAEMDLDAICAKLAYDKHTLVDKPAMGLLVKFGQMYHIGGKYGVQIDTDVIRAALVRNQMRGSR